LAAVVAHRVAERFDRLRLVVEFVVWELAVDEWERLARVSALPSAPDWPPIACCAADPGRHRLTN